MCKTYGYCRISRKEQSIARQIRNIRAEYPEAILIEEAFTGTKVEGREKFQRLLKTVKPDDTIVFDSVSRMSRNASEGIELYEQLYSKGVNLVFLKEHHIDTATYDKATKESIGKTGDEVVDAILEGVNKAMRILRRRQIEQAFEQAEKEVKDLRQRTSEGIETARLNGKQVGQINGTKLTTKKSIEMKAKIRRYSRDFDGTMNDSEVMQMTGIARNTFYKYKREMKAE